MKNPSSITKSLSNRFAPSLFWTFVVLEVRADVSKAGQLFVSDIWLHRAEDSFDLSFEAGFPDVRWLTDNIVEFYRPEYFDQGADS